MEVYLKVIGEAVFFFPLIALLFTLPYVLCNYRKYGSVFSVRILIVYSFVLYMLCVFFLVILPLPSIEEVAAMTGPRTQLIPFNFICDILKESHFVASDPGSWFYLIINRAFFQVLFNVVMTMPFGVYLRYYFGCHLKKTLLLSFLLSLFFELTQLSGLYFIYPRSYRLFDVDDLMANTLGGVLGYLLVGPFLNILPTRKEIDEASFRRGREVSLARRLLALTIDVPCAGLFALVLEALLPIARDTAWFSFFGTYFVLIPVLLRGRTVGKLILRIGILSEDGSPARWYQYLLRYGSLWAVLFVLPAIVDSGLEAAAAVAGLGMIWTVMIRGIFRTVYFFFLVAEIVMLALHRPLFYEKLSKTGLVSTIRKEK